MILLVKARDLEVGMEVVGPVLFADYGVVTALQVAGDRVDLTLDDQPTHRQPQYEFEVLIEP